ncbi:MAG: 2-octaprenyl-6-methoxyphenyl hydroxylase [Bermanella sp.]
MKQEFDVIIVGGGMTGASLALLLTTAMAQGLRVALIETHEVSSQQVAQPSFDDRSTALSLSSQRIFAKLGVWPTMAAQACAIKHIQVSQQQQFGRIRLHAADSQVEAMGYVLENRIMGQQLMTALLRLPSLSIFSPARVSAYSITSQGAQLEVVQQEQTLQLQAQLVVLADGADSAGCRQLGIIQQRHDYQQDALVCNVSFDAAHQNWAFERFTMQGPMALLPMTNNRYALVWCMEKQQAQDYLALSSSDFAQRLQQALGHKLGRVQRIGERVSYPLNLVQAQEQVRSHVVVLGNAAHALHPVAGQGFNLALRDALALARQIERRWPTPSLGSLSLLNDYVAAQVQDQNITIGLSHGLPKAFTQAGAGCSLLRALGMSALDVSPLAKKLFSRQAMGLVGAADTWQP